MKSLGIVYFVKYDDYLPYLTDKQSVCSLVEEACNKKIYNNQLNPGKGVDYTYKIEFVDKSVIHIIIG